MNIKYYRQLQGLTQVQLCEKLDIKQYNLAKYERDSLGVPNELIPQIAKVLGVTTDLLFGERPQDKKTTEPKKSSREGKLLEAFRKLPATEQRVIVKQAEALSRN